MFEVEKITTEQVFLLGPIIDSKQAITLQYLKDNIPDIPKGLLEEILLNNKLLLELLKLLNKTTKEQPKETKKILDSCSSPVYEYYPTPSFIRRDFKKLICKNQEIKKQNKPILYPVEVGYFQILGIPGGFKIDGKKIVSKIGEDLKSRLPIYFNYKVDKNIELIGISKYIIDWRGEAILTYETYNHNTDVRRIFEAGTSLWNKYSV